MLKEVIHKQDIKEWLDKGHSFNEIAEMYGTSTAYIYKLAKDWNLRRPKKPKNIGDGSFKDPKRSFPLGPHMYGVCSKKFMTKRQNVLNQGKWKWDLKMIDLDWPTHCPILGLELDWENPWSRKMENSVSFDRIDNTKGYIRGNVKIISWRAYRIKNDGLAEEHIKIAEYIKGNS